MKRGFGQGAGPGDIVGVDVEDCGVWIDRGAAPFRATIETGKDYRVFTDAEGNELAFAAKRFEFLESPLVNSVGAFCERVLGEILAGEGSGACGEPLLACGYFARKSAGRIVAVFDGKEWLAGGAVEKEDEALLGGLRDGLDGFSVALRGEQDWRRRKVAVPEMVAHALN